MCIVFVSYGLHVPDIHYICHFRANMSASRSIGITPSSIGTLLLQQRPQRLFRQTRFDGISNIANADTELVAPSTPSSSSERDRSFANEFQRNHIATSAVQRIILSAGSSVAALWNPHRHDAIACLGETTGEPALTRLLNEMQASPEGCRILADRPRISSTRIDLAAFGRLPANTFGANYCKFLLDNVQYCACSTCSWIISHAWFTIPGQCSCRMWLPTRVTPCSLWPTSSWPMWWLAIASATI